MPCQKIKEGSKTRELILECDRKFADLLAEGKKDSLKECGKESVVLNGEETLQRSLEGGGLVSEKEDLGRLVHCSE